MTRDTPVALFLNGGSAGKEVFSAFAAQLSARGVKAVTFDYTMDAKSGGPGMSLVSRLREAESMLSSATAGTGRVAVIGYSMGGHTAIELSARSDIDLLVLISPAAYGDHVRGIAFGDEFRQVAARSGSWRGALVFDKLRSLGARVILMVPGHDDVIPVGVTQQYRQIALSRPNDVVLEFADSPHQLIPWLDRHPAEYSQISELIVSTLDRLF